MNAQAGIGKFEQHSLHKSDIVMVVVTQLQQLFPYLLLHPIPSESLRDEVVRGVSSGTSAYVATWNTADNILKVSIPSGDFSVGEVIVVA